LGVNTINISFSESVGRLRDLKEGFENGVVIAPKAIHEVDFKNGEEGLQAFEAVDKGSKEKQVLIIA